MDTMVTALPGLSTVPVKRKRGRPKKHWEGTGASRIARSPKAPPIPPRPPVWNTPDEKREWLRIACKNSLEILCNEILSPFKGYGPLPYFHRQRAAELDEDLEMHYNAINVWSRGLWKTKTVTVGQTVQRILRNPDIAILIRHFDEEIAKEICEDLKAHFRDNPYMRFVFPEFCAPVGEKFGHTTDFTVPNRRFPRTEPTVMCSGLNSTVTGLHFDHIHDDDVETDKSVGRDVSPAVREKHWSRWQDWTQLAERSSFAKIRGTYSMVGTPWHYDGIIYRAKARAKEFGFKFRWHPAYRPSNNQMLCPQAYPREALQRDRAGNDPYEFSCAILLDPVDEEFASFQMREELWWDAEPSTYRPFKRVMSVDPAYTNSSLSDYTGIVVVDILPDDTWVVLASYSPRLEPLSLINHLHELARRWKPDPIYIEAIAAGKILAKWLMHESERLGERLPVIPVKKHKIMAEKGARKGTGKNRRIQMLSPRVEAGKFRIWRSAEGAGALWDEMRRWPLGTDQHLLDALATLEEYAPEGKGTMAEPKRPYGPGEIGWWNERIEEEKRMETARIGSWRKPWEIVQRRAWR